MGVFDRTKAVQYAIRWALGRNPAFPNYSSLHGGGGDCTNFVSQVMFAAGWTMIEGIRFDSSAWWARRDATTNTWSSARWFADFLEKSPRVSECSIDDLDNGDIVMLQAPDFDHPDHAMVVTKKLCAMDGDEIYLTYHSTDTLYRSLQDIQSAYSPHTKFYYWKVADVYTDPIDPNANIRLVNRVA